MTLFPAQGCHEAASAANGAPPASSKRSLASALFLRRSLLCLLSPKSPTSSRHAGEARTVCATTHRPHLNCCRVKCTAPARGTCFLLTQHANYWRSSPSPPGPLFSRHQPFCCISLFAPGGPALLPLWCKPPALINRQAAEQPVRKSNDR
jgi:hypothetical protein